MTELLLTLHRTDAYLSIGWMLIAGIYGLASHRRHRAYVSSGYKAVLIVGAALLAVQVALGLSLLLSGLRPGSALHIAIYGALSPLLLPGAYLYVRQQGGSHPNLAFGLVSLFLFAFLIRGTFTA